MNLWDRFEGHGIQFIGVNTGASHTWMTDLGLDFSAIDDSSNTILWSYADSGFTYPLIYIIRRDMVISANTTSLQTEDILEGLTMDAVYLRDPIDVEMVMDVSDSMNSPSPSDPGGDSKLTMMKQASTLITDFLNDHGQTDDRMGLIWFTDDATEYEPPAGKLLSIPVHWADLRAQINAHGTGTCTAMGAGLQKAFDTLSPSTQKRFAILCTDGMQNIEPKVTKVGSNYEIIDSGGWLCGGHSAVPAHAGVDITSYNTCIHTIGIGITATYENLLQEITNETGGFYRGTNDPETDLDLIYFLDLCNCMAGGSPAVAHHSTGRFYPRKCEAIESFCINRSVRKMTVMLSWKEYQKSNLTFWLYSPEGTLIDLQKEMKLFENHCLATIYLPRHQDGAELSHVGHWQMVIRGETQETYADYHAFVIAEDRETKFHLDYPRKTYAVGDIIPIRMKLTEKEEPLIKVNEIMMETVEPRIPFAELLTQYKTPPCEFIRKSTVGKSIFEKKPVLAKLEAMISDHRFKKLLTPVRKQLSLQNGNLECKVEGKEILIPFSCKKAGLHSFKVTVRCETPENGPICRTDMVSVFVSPGIVVSKLTNVNLMRVTAKGMAGARICVTPKNKYGQLLGPGLSNEFTIMVDKKAVKAEIKDQLDGTYDIALLIPRKAKVKKRVVVNIKFQKKSVWKGNL